MGAVSLPCFDDPEEPGEKLCRPEEYVSPFAWDVADKTLFRPLTQVFSADVGFGSKNVNAFDEVPNSSWFENRLGMFPMSPEDVLRGSCGKNLIDPEGSADGTWLVDMGKPNGANPGFRVNIEGVGKFMLKADQQGEGEKATGATAIASRFYHAMGYYSPCDTVVYVRKSLFSLKPGLQFADNSGVKRNFDQAALNKVLDNAQKRGDLIRMVASKWLPGRTVGPFRYEDTRDEDPNDVIPHEDRRELRGARVIAAWLNHFDSREQNTMTTWMALDEKKKDSSPGYLLHWYIDLGDCFGSRWEWDPMTRRLGNSYYMDFADVGIDLIGLGIPQRPWDRAKVSPGGEMFFYFSADDFDPDAWKGGYPNPAFQRMEELDAAWATRILTRFTDAHIVAAMRAGDYTDKGSNAYLFDAIRRRLHAIRTRYFAKLSPIADVTVQGRTVCGVDLARKDKVYDPAAFSYTATAYVGVDLDEAAQLDAQVKNEGAVCVKLPSRALPTSLAPNDASRYLVVDVRNGAAPGPLRLHAYDQGEKGIKLVGIERPEDDDAP